MDKKGEFLKIFHLNLLQCCFDYDNWNYWTSQSCSGTGYAGWFSHCHQIISASCERLHAQNFSNALQLEGQDLQAAF